MCGFWGFGLGVQDCSWCLALDVRFWGSGFRVQGAGFRVQGSGFKVQSSGFRVQGPRSRIQGLGCRVQGSGSRVQGPRFRVSGSDHGMRHLKKSHQRSRSYREIQREREKSVYIYIHT